MKIVGIDPGCSGALTYIDDTELLVYDMPTYDITKGESVRKRIDIPRLKHILTSLAPSHVYIEQVSAQPGNGASAAFTFGWACAVAEAVVVCCGLPFSYVTPQKWKKTMQCPKDKDGARMRASQLLPQYAHNWDRKKDDGRAEAALIALYGRQIHGK